MKTTKFADGSELKVSENSKEEQELLLEFPNPFLANRIRQLADELRALDNNITVELLLELDGTATIFCRDTSLFPHRIVQTTAKDEELRYDNFAQVMAKRLHNYWIRKREKRNGAQGQ